MFQYLAAATIVALTASAASAQTTTLSNPPEYFTLKLSVEDVNLVAEGLGEIPMKRSGPLWGRITKQLEEQSTLPAPAPTRPPRAEKPAEAQQLPPAEKPAK